MVRRILALLCCAALAPQAAAQNSAFVTVEDGAFRLGTQPFCFAGTNLWYGAYLGAEGATGDHDRLRRELDLLKSTGITNLRVLGASEKSPMENSLSVTFRDRSENYNEDLLRGLDRMLHEVARRGMRAVIYLNNFWEWSGGMGTYLYWTNGGAFINLGDPAHPWPAFADFSAGFYDSREAQERYFHYVRQLVTRVNTANGRAYADDPAIMAWQLANEPRPGDHNELGFSRLPAYYEWIGKTAALIKSLDPNHLVSLGSEGTMGCLQDEQCFLDAHADTGIDYLTFHMWPKNWGWFKARNPGGSYQPTLQKADDYISAHLALAKRLGKPIVLEEFGLERDGGGFSPALSTSLRDRYYGLVFKRIENSLETDGLFRGSNFWTWGGYGRAEHDDYRWRAGDRAYTGDPPQEAQGLNSVFNSDVSTLNTIKRHAGELARLGCGPAIVLPAE